MLRNSIFLISILLGLNCTAQTISSNNFAVEFESAYLANPLIPKGILEGVAFAQTRITHIAGNNEGCIGLPQVSGVMGLTENGQGYFNNNLILVSQLSGISVNDIKTNPQKNILAYALAYSSLLTESAMPTNDLKTHCQILEQLSEIPKNKNVVNHFALNCFTYEVFQFLNNPQKQIEFNLPNYAVDFEAIYGVENYKVLSSQQIVIESDNVTNSDGVAFNPNQKSLEYPPALWVATPTCNYSSRSGTPVSAVTIHTIQGSYAGAISWAQNCSSNVSYHYVARSSDGQITQMVYEADKGWHVGSENPYTIGIEHEGYVSNPAWYTVAMYTGSANLVKDICNSGYGINPLRTFQGPATSGSNVLGSCTKIKGHQHYPNQSHTDPGINWNWEYYYQLINNTTPIVSYTASTGTLYDSGGAGANYSNDERKLYLIQPSGVVNVTVQFQAFNLENNWDYMYLYDGTTTAAPLLGVYTGTTLPPNVSSTGTSLLIEFRSDCATTAAGWQLSWSGVPGPVPGDVIAPTSVVSFSNNWKTTNFLSDFADADNSGGSGVHHKFYQVIDYDGVEWRANASNGFFSDNFDAAIHPDWTISTGNWSIAATYLNQSDDANGNTNIYAALNQNTHTKFLYHWAGKISGSGTNRRVGFHFMCDDASLPNRGNSYFVWFRQDNGKLQFYKVVNDVFTLEADLPLALNVDQWYDFKTTYNKSSGQIQVWVNDVFVANWVDSSPYTIGNAISFRSGNAIYDVNDLKVYHNRGIQELVTVGVGNDVGYQNPNPLTPSAKIKSIVIDSSSNVSTVNSKFANVDWTAPSNVNYVYDGTSSDIAVTSSNTSLSANWSSSIDLNSGVESYWYAIGTSAGATDVLNWTDNWFDTTVTHTGLTLTYGTTYYFSIKVENGAGLFSTPINSDGQLCQIPVNPPVANFNVTNTFVCVTDSIQFLNASTDASSYSWSIPGAIPSTSTAANPYFKFPSSGTYEVTLTATGPGGVDSDVQMIAIETPGLPLADFNQSASVVDVSNGFVTFVNNSSNANGYYWNFGDGGTSNDFEPWHEYTAVGLYSVSLIAINGTCPNDTTWSTVEVVDDLGISATNSILFSVYPNPTNGDITLQFSSEVIGQSYSYCLRDASGRIIVKSSEKLAGNKLQIKLTELNLEPGVYFVQVNFESTVSAVKLMVE